MTTNTIGKTTNLYHGKVLDLKSERHRLEGAGVTVVMSVTEASTGVRLTQIEEPDDVLIGLEKPA